LQISSKQQSKEHKERREKQMKLWGVVLSFAMFSGMSAAQTLNCNMQDYKSVEGVKAEASHNSVELTWQGEAGAQLRAQFSLRNGQPVVQELAAKKSDGPWIVLGKDLTPQFEVTTGRRRISSVESDVWSSTNGMSSGMRRWLSLEPSACRVRLEPPTRSRARRLVTNPIAAE
jgi:hypothetical protein